MAASGASPPTGSSIPMIHGSPSGPGPRATRSPPASSSHRSTPRCPMRTAAQRRARPLPIPPRSTGRSTATTPRAARRTTGVPGSAGPTAPGPPPDDPSAAPRYPSRSRSARIRGSKTPPVDRRARSAATSAALEAARHVDPLARAGGPVQPGQVAALAEAGHRLVGGRELGADRAPGRLGRVATSPAPLIGQRDGQAEWRAHRAAPRIARGARDRSRARARSPTGGHRGAPDAPVVAWTTVVRVTTRVLELTLGSLTCPGSELAAPETFVTRRPYVSRAVSMSAIAGASRA